MSTYPLRGEELTVGGEAVIVAQWQSDVRCAMLGLIYKTVFDWWLYVQILQVI